MGAVLGRATVRPGAAAPGRRLVRGEAPGLDGAGWRAAGEPQAAARGFLGLRVRARDPGLLPPGRLLPGPRRGHGPRLDRGASLSARHGAWHALLGAQPQR